MPLQVIEKPKTEARYAPYLPRMVPLRLMEIKSGHCGGNTARQQEVKEKMEIGDICVLIYHQGKYNTVILHCRTGEILTDWYADYLLFVQDYNTQQVIICNDNNPAPVI